MRHLLKIQKIFLIAAILTAFGIGIKLIFIPFEGYDIKIAETFMVLWVMFSLIQISLPSDRNGIITKSFGYSGIVFSALAGISAVLGVWDIKSDISVLIFENLLNIAAGCCLIKLILSTSRVLYTVYGDFLRFLSAVTAFSMTVCLCVYINIGETTELVSRIAAIAAFFASGCNLLLLYSFITEYSIIQKKDRLILMKTSQQGVYIDLFGNIMQVSKLSISRDSASEKLPDISAR
jgi:hypothetical protein